MESYTKRWIIFYFSLSLYVGLSTAIFGPSLIKLVEQTGSSLRELSYLFSGGAFAYMFGSWLAGRLFDRYPGHRLLSIALPLLGACLISVPFIGNSWILVAVAMLCSLAAGIMDVGGNTLLIRIPDLNLGPVMNGLHFFFGLGAFLAPMILAGSLQLSGGIEWGFWGFGILSFLLMIQLIGLPESKMPETASSGSPAAKLELTENRSILILVIALFYFTFVGVEMGYGNWLTSYAYQMGLADEKASVLLTSLYWGSFTVSRLISIPLATRIKPGSIVIYDILGSMIGLGLVFFFPHQPIILWIGTVILGFSVASLFPTMLTYAESMLDMTSKVTSTFFISGSVGSMLLPWIIGQTVGSSGEIIIIRILFLTLCAAGVILLVLLGLSKRTVRVTGAGK